MISLIFYHGEYHDESHDECHGECRDECLNGDDDEARDELPRSISRGKLPTFREEIRDGMKCRECDE